MIRWLVTRRATVMLAVACVTIFGLVAYVDLPREAAPDVDIPFVVVATPYVGVSPSDVESLVTDPLENELAGLNDIKHMRSTSSEGISIVMLEFEPEVVIEDALQRVRDRVSRARPKLPEDVEEPEVTEVSMSDVPVMIVTIAGPVDEVALKQLGEDLEEDAQRLPGVLDVDLSGGREREIQVQVDPLRLSFYGLSFDDVIGAINSENVNIPGGDVTSGDANFLLRVPGEFALADEIEGVAVKRVGDRPVFVRDVARVVDGFAERESYARMNGAQAVSVAVKKRAGANIVETAQAVKALVAEHSERWPPGVEYRVLGDQSKFVDDMVGELENGIITALLLVMAVVLFFMGVRNSLFVALAIPLSMLLSFLFIAIFGMTLNMMVLFALIMALGMLVDNAIVLVENIYRHVEEGADLQTASIEGTKEVAGAVTASTATTVAAFAPLLFWTGMMGQFMGFMPKTIVIVLLCSLAVAVWALPVFTSKLMKKSSKRRESVTENPVMRGYRSMLEWSIRHRYVAGGIGIASLIGTFMAYGALNHGTEFFPEVEPNRATITVRAPDGTDLETTDRIVRSIEGILAGEENVDVFVAETGVSGGSDDPSQASNGPTPQSARITIDFLPDANTAKAGETIRVEPTNDTIDRIRDAVAEIPGAAIEVEKERMGPPVGASVEVLVAGEDVHEVGALAAKVRRDLREIPGVTELGDDYRVGRPEMRLRIDRGAAKRVGVSTRDVASTIRTAVAGTVATTIRDGEDEHDVVVEVSPEHRGDLQAVLALRVPGKLDTSPDTFPVPLSTVASYELAGGTGAVMHLDQDLVVTIRGSVEEGVNENDVRAQVQSYLDAKEFPPGFHARMGGANDEQKETQEFLSRAFGVAIFLIALVLVAQFNRFDLPFIILASVVLSLIGVLWGLIITGMPFGVMMTGLGVISLAGIVVNNAIVLLDYVEQLRAQGIPMFDALIQAGMTRFRPVVLTAITTVLGLVPMAVGVSVDFRTMKLIVGSQSATWWGPMAVAVIAGLAVATVLTLVMVPTLYSIFEDIRRLMGRVVRRGERTSEAPAAAE